MTLKLLCSYSLFMFISLFFVSMIAQPFRTEQLAQVEDVVWGLEFLLADELMFTERKGAVKVLSLKTKKVISISGLPNVEADGQGGLLDIQKDKNYAKTKRIYFCYSVKAEDGLTTELGRATYNPEKRSLSEWESLFRAMPVSKHKIHFGCRLAFDREGDLWMTVGDRNRRDQAQVKTSHLGKTLKFKDVTKAPEIFSYGHRNPQGLAIHPVTGDVWVNEHGPRGGDEINLIKKSANYGWPIITYGREYYGPKIGEGTSKPGMEQPLKQFTPSIAPSSLMIYSGKVFKSWAGDFFSGALVLTHLNRVKFDKNLKPVEEERLLEKLEERIRDVVEGPDGLIYFSTDSGKIFRLTAL